jgi:hypothetical protein
MSTGDDGVDADAPGLGAEAAVTLPVASAPPLGSDR